MKFNILKRHVRYSGFMQMHELELEIEAFEGQPMRLKRELVIRGNAVAVLIHDPVIDQFLLVEQFRAGAIEHGDPWLLELVAGMVEPGEDEIDVAGREAFEEANIKIHAPVKLCDYMGSPGGSTEKIAIYYAKADLSNAGGVYGLADEREDIRVVLFSAKQLEAALVDGRLNNAMSQVGVLWYFRLQASLSAS